MNAHARITDPLPISYSDTFGWYVVYTKVNAEVRAEMGLNAIGYKTYLPSQVRWLWRKGARARERVNRPLFPRYLFVGVEEGQQYWHAIRRTNGVADVLCQDDIPVRIPGAEVERLLADEAAGLFDRTRQPAFTAGDRVLVDVGPMCQLSAEVAKADDGRTVEVLHAFLGRLNRMKVNLERVSRVENPVG